MIIKMGQVIIQNLIIKMNKQLSPITIIKTSEAEEIMFKIYDLAL